MVKHSWLRSMGREVDRTEERRFAIFFQQGKWMIEIHPMEATNAIRQTVGSENGVDIIHTRYGQTEPGIVIVETNAFPTGFHFPIASHLWVMYASEAFWERWNGTNLPPIHKYAYEYYGVSHPRPQYGDQRAEVVLNDGTPRLPTQVKFFNSGWSEFARTNREPRRMRKPFDNGYLNATYDSGDVRTVGNLKIPWEFVFKGLSPNLNGKSSNDLYVSFLCEVKVSFATNKCSINPLRVDLPKRFAVMDHRLEKASNAVVSVSYTRDDFQILPSVQQLQTFHNTPKKPPRRQHGAIVGALFLLLLIAPILMVVAPRMRRVKQARKESLRSAAHRHQN